MLAFGHITCPARLLLAYAMSRRVVVDIPHLSAAAVSSWFFLQAHNK